MKKSYHSKTVPSVEASTTCRSSERVKSCAVAGLIVASIGHPLVAAPARVAAWELVILYDQKHMILSNTLTLEIGAANAQARAGAAEAA